MNDLPRILAGLSPAKRALLARRLGARRDADATLPPIVRRAEPGAPQPLSYEQRRLWFLDQLSPGSAAYNIPAALRLRGRLDVPALSRALSEVERRHEALRTRFADTGGELAQLVAAHAPVELPFEDLSTLPDAARELEALRVAGEEARRSFDLAAGPVWRARLLRLSHDEHVLSVVMHHIVSDGWSVGILVRETATLYAAYARGEESPLAELPVQYADYAAWQRAELRGETVERQLEYWRRQLSGLAALRLPADKPREASSERRGAMRRFEVGAELAEGLKELSRGEGATLFMTLLAALKLLLRFHARQERIAVACPVANRQRVETQGLIGFFLNTLIFRTDCSGEITLRELLRRVRRVCLDGYANQDVPFDRMVEAVHPERSADGQPLFQVAYTLHSVDDEPLRVEGLTISPLDVSSGTVPFDLVLNMLDTPGGLGGAFLYDADLFESATVETLTADFEIILRLAVERPDSPLGEVEAELADADRRRQAAQEREYEAARLNKFMTTRRKAVTPGRAG